MAAIFIHDLNWSTGVREETFCPVDNMGNLIPHIFGYTFDSGEYVPAGCYTLDHTKYDMYLVAETAHSRPTLWGWASWYVPTGEVTLVDSNYITSTSEVEWRCDSGCMDCGYEYPHTNWIHKSVSGIFLVPKGAEVVEVVKFEAGTSYFPEEFVLTPHFNNFPV